MIKIDILANSLCNVFNVKRNVLSSPVQSIWLEKYSAFEVILNTKLITSKTVVITYNRKRHLFPVGVRERVTPRGLNF